MKDWNQSNLCLLLTGETVKWALDIHAETAILTGAPGKPAGPGGPCSPLSP